MITFQNKFNYSINSSHTELWFLPDKNLYNEDCSNICKKFIDEHQIEENIMDGGGIDDEEAEDIIQE